MRRVHEMPFGARVLPGGGVAFRLWAPTVTRVELLLEDPARAIPLAPARDGFHEVVVPGAGPGSRYRYRVDEGPPVPDPASRFQPEDVDGPSEVVDPGAFPWTDGDWGGRRFEEAVFYELHVGTFSPGGTYLGVEERLDHLVDLGVTALELMPVADFSGRRNWGYDGVLPFAPDHVYGRPEDLKRLVQAAHARNLMVFLDVVYNHLGPKGNHLARYAAPFFHPVARTVWGPALWFDGPDTGRVRAFFIHNALYWLEEYHLDGLRLDATHAIQDHSPHPFLRQLADAVQAGPGRARPVHLVMEDPFGQYPWLGRGRDGRPRRYAARWHEPVHHALHVLLTGEHDGYYAPFAEDTLPRLGEALAGVSHSPPPEELLPEEPLLPSGDLAPRGQEPARPPSAFVVYLQNHDQVGNRAYGERITAVAPEAAVRAATALLLLSPQIPLLFMGQEWGATSPFLFFCDFTRRFGDHVAQGRRWEFARFRDFADPAARALIPHPNHARTFRRSALRWKEVATPPHGDWLAFHRELLRIRREEIVPRLGTRTWGRFHLVGDRGLALRWSLEDGAWLHLLANLGTDPLPHPGFPPGRELWIEPSPLPEAPDGSLPGWFLGAWLDAP